MGATARNRQCFDLLLCKTRTRLRITRAATGGLDARRMRFRLPTTATAPFCPSEVRGSVAFDPGLSTWRKLLRMAGPGLLVSVGYMDPGNWATDIEAGSRFGYDLLFVVICCSVAAMVLQTFSLRLGIVAGKDLAQVSSEQYPKPIARIQWLLAELSIIACDLAEVLGCALASRSRR